MLLGAIVSRDAQIDDALRFVVTSSEPRYVAVLSRDGAGQVSIYHPNGPRAEKVEAGVERALDASVILDEVLGEERLYALTCSAPIELAPLSDALRRTGAEPAWPRECSLDRFVLHKEERSADASAFPAHPWRAFRRWLAGACLALLGLCASSASAAVTRVALVIGNDRGLPDRSRVGNVRAGRYFVVGRFLARASAGASSYFFRLYDAHGAASRADFAVRTGLALGKRF